MKIIKGKHAEAIVYTEEIEDTAVKQIRTLCDQPFAKDADIRIMPDVHAGAGCTIGTTMKITDKVVPNLVGVDIGCGMETAILGNVELDLVKLDRFVRKKIPSGFKTRGVPHEGYKHEVADLLKDLRCKVNTEKAMKSIGTLGGGNHFIEANVDDNGDKYIVIHSGSRHMGLEIAGYYQKLAYKKLSETPREDAGAIVAKLKAEGREAEISRELEKLKDRNHVEKDLAYLEGQDMEDYLHDMGIAQRYARYNRYAMMSDILDFLGMNTIEVKRFTTIHNYIDLDTMILRKGAVSAKEGELLLIPINMRDGSLLCEGLGNDNWNQSAPHGAGRLMSRMQAMKTLDMEKFKAEMSDVYSTSVNKDTLDESPMAYKSMDNILSNISPTARVITRIKPIYNFKASEGRGR